MESRWIVLLCCLAAFITVAHGASLPTRSSKGTSPVNQARLNQVECLAGVNGSESVNGTSSRTGRRSSGPDDQALTALFAGQMQFSLDLFKAVFNMSNKQNGGLSNNRSDNIFLSPMSVYSSLLLAYFGSNNRTEEQLSRVLGFHDMDKIGAVQAYKLVKFTRQLMRVAGLVKYDFDIANRAYFNDGENIRPCMKDIFNEDIEILNFAEQPEDARQMINRWVEGVTRDKIKDFATPDVINSNTRMALVNAAYFKGQWASQFKPADTQPARFFFNNKDFAIANMMFQKGRFRTAISEELQAQVMEMPFLGDDVSFYVILPQGNASLADTVNRLTLETLREAMSRTFPGTSIEVGLPKFRMEQTLQLRNVLFKLGLTDLFDSFNADLSGFTGAQGLSVDSATHKAFIEVNEEGSEAAAATALVDLRMARPLTPTKFICDHPFLFLVYDNLSESILFMGAYRNPKA